MDTRQRVVCFTGHRPKDLPWRDNRKDLQCILFKQKLQLILEDLISQNYTTFISGMATGSDMLCAFLVLAMKRSKYPQLKLKCYVPSREVNPHWTEQQKNDYHYLLSHADRTFALSHDYHYNNYAIIERNKAMVDDADYVVGIYRGVASGTRNTLLYAVEQEKPILIIDPVDLSIRESINSK